MLRPKSAHYTNTVALHPQPRATHCGNQCDVLMCNPAGVLIMFTEKKVMNIIAGGVAIAAGVFVMIGIAIFLGYHLHDKITADTLHYFQLSYCFALSIVAFVLCLASGIAFFLATSFEDPGSYLIPSKF